jgi:hypothetical protein
MSQPHAEARWHVTVRGDITPIRGLPKVEVQPDGSIIATMSQAELIDHFDLLPSLGLELISVERIRA